MDELAQQLQALLKDPEQLAQLSSLAASLGMPVSPPSPEAQPVEEAPSQPSAVPSAETAPDAAALRKLLPLLSQSMGREAQLFQAIRPFLSAGDQRRADRAMRAARLSRLARTAMEQLGSGGLL